MNTKDLIERLRERAITSAYPPNTLEEQAACKIEELEKELYFLSCLDAAGVDNWDGYDYAQEMFQEKYSSID